MCMHENDRGNRITIYPNTNPIMHIPISEPFEPKQKAFSFLNLSKEPWTCDDSDLRTSRAC